MKAAATRARCAQSREKSEYVLIRGPTATTYEAPRSDTDAVGVAPVGRFAGRRPASTLHTALDSGHEPDTSTEGAGEPWASARVGTTSTSVPPNPRSKSKERLMEAPGTVTRPCHGGRGTGN
jgi:hypothetical protein